MKPAKPRRLAYDMAIHGLQQLFSRGVRRQIQVRIQSVELKYVVVQRSWSRSGPKVSRGMSAAGRNARAISRPVGQIAWSKAFRKTFGGSRNIEGGPVQGVGGGLVRRVLDIVKNYGVRFQTFRRTCRWDRDSSEIRTRAICFPRAPHCALESRRHPATRCC